jgi:hypothetical protein
MSRQQAMAIIVFIADFWRSGRGKREVPLGIVM